MASNRIQIKRSTANASVTGLQAGELAFTQASNTFWVGAPDGTSGSIRIGGQQTPGTLTANQALVANATSGIDKVITANAVITSIWANGSAGAAGDLLFSNSSGVYWASAGQVGVNVNATYAWTNVHTFSNAINGNTINATSFTTSGVTANTTGVFTTGTVNAATLSVGTTVVANSTTLNANGLVVNSSGGYFSGLVNASAFTTTGNANAANHYSGANAVFNATNLAWTGNTTTSPTVTLANTGSFTIGNSSTTETTAVISVANSTGNVQITPGTTSILATGLINASAFTTTGNANAANHYSGANAVFNSTSLAWTGNTTTSPTITLANTGSFTIGNSSTTQTTSIITVANSTGNVQITPAGISGNGASITSINATNITTGTLAYAQIPANIVNTTGSFTLGGNTTLGGTNTVISSNLTVSGTFSNLSGTVANTLGVYSVGVVNGSTLSVGTSFTANATVVNAAAVNVVGQVNAATIYATTSANIASAVQANSTGLWTTGTVNAATLSVGATVVANSTTLNSNGLIANSTGVYATGIVNATSHTSGAIGTGTGGTVQNTTTMFVGNNTVNTVITSAGLSVNGATVANNTGVYTGIVNGSTIQVGSNFTANTTKVTFTGANIDATSAVLAIRDIIATGNLIVSGTVVSVNTSTLVVNDNIIELGLNNTTTDVVDTGWFSPAGNATNIWYSGLVRQAAKSSNSNPYFWLFGSNTNPNTATTVDVSANSTTATLQAYLVPYGTGGAFVANSSAVTLVANSTVSVSITGNTLTLSTALAGTSGGTGKSTMTNNAILVGNSTNGYNELALGTSGYVLQSNGTALVYDFLDGGTF